MVLAYITLLSSKFTDEKRHAIVYGHRTVVFSTHQVGKIYAISPAINTLITVKMDSEATVYLRENCAPT